MKRALVLTATILAGSALTAGNAEAFCGFYVSKADAKLFNKASQVVMVRDQDRTVLTMASDYRGDPKEFALVIPVPTSITREQIHIGDPAIVEHLDAYSAPRTLSQSWESDSSSFLIRTNGGLDVLCCLTITAMTLRGLGPSAPAGSASHARPHDTISPAIFTDIFMRHHLPGDQ